MDRLYKMVNQTISSPGEDVLYDMMRRPVGIHWFMLILLVLNVAVLYL